MHGRLNCLFTLNILLLKRGRLIKTVSLQVDIHTEKFLLWIKIFSNGKCIQGWVGEDGWWKSCGLWSNVYRDSFYGSKQARTQAASLSFGLGPGNLFFKSLKILKALKHCQQSNERWLPLGFRCQMSDPWILRLKTKRYFYSYFHLYLIWIIILIIRPTLERRLTHGSCVWSPWNRSFHGAPLSPPHTHHLLPRLYCVFIYTSHKPHVSKTSLSTNNKKQNKKRQRFPLSRVCLPICLFISIAITIFSKKNIILWMNILRKKLNWMAFLSIIQRLIEFSIYIARGYFIYLINQAKCECFNVGSHASLISSFICAFVFANLCTCVFVYLRICVLALSHARHWFSCYPGPIKTIPSMGFSH